MENDTLKFDDPNGCYIEEEDKCDGEDIENDIMIEEQKLDLKVGMDFATADELFAYYGNYGNEKGFPVMKRSNKKGEDGIVRWVMYACGRSGKSESNSKNAFKMHPVTKTNCGARINAVLDSNGRWRVTIVDLDHNHDLSPGKSRYYKRNRTMQPFVKRRLEMNDRAGIRPNKNFNSFVVEAGGHDNVPFLEKDCYNYLGKARRLRLGDGDASAIQNYFTKMQANNSNFYYLLDLDEEARIKNVFWADARSRALYEEFGEVITFDTTYLTNKYDMPFAPFVGVNHHGHSILLGCALLSSEDTNTFIWLFRTWLECMGRRAPNAIITDQAKAMQNAIEVVFPNTRHRWCLWHIMKKIPEKLGGYTDYESIKKKMKDAVYESLSTDEFEEKWNLFIDEFQLHKNDWLNGLYIERRRWVPVFVKYIFWAGMSTTQRSESMNAFFDGYVNSKTTLKQFVEQYENALRSKAEKENQADFSSFNSRIPCITHFEIEKQFQGIYTTAKFKEFQNELKGKIYCEVSSVKRDSDFMEYDILEDKIGGIDRQKTFTVSFQPSDCDIKCNCRLFEFRGILCRHSIVVLIQQRVKIVPEKYILRRWRKDIKRCHTKVKITYFDWMQNPENEQFDRLCSAFYQVADLATGNKDKVEHVMQWIKKLRDDLSKSEGTCESSPPSLVPDSQLSTSPSVADISPLVEEIDNVRSPLAAPKRGRPPFKRKQSTCEQVVQKKKGKEKASAKEKKKKTKATIRINTTTSNSEKELNDGYIGVELGMTQESITTKVPYGGCGSKATEFGMYNVPQYGNVSFGNQSMTQIPCPNDFYGRGFPPFIQNFSNGTHVSSNGEFSHENEPKRNNGANSSLQIQGYHYPFWNGHDMPFGGI